MGEDVDAVAGDPGVGNSTGRRADRTGATRDRDDHKNRRRHSRAAQAHSTDRNEDDNDDGNADDDEDDSDAGSDYSSVSVDELPPIRAYGHTYHGSGVLLMPNDESERARLEIQHQLFKLCLEGSLTATKLPKDRPLNILDIGSGTGNWAIEMAQQYPQAKIMGIDLTAALLPTNVPSNVVFEVEDATDPWDREKNSLDFVHMRNLVGGGVPEWKPLFEQAYEHLKPGGMIEFAEVRPRYFDLIDSSSDEPSAPSNEEERNGPMAGCREFELRFAQMAAVAGVDFDPIPKIPSILTDVGFEKVGRWSDLVPIQAVGHDEKMVRKGAQFAQMLEYGGLENYSLAVFAKGGWDENDTRALLQRVHKESRDPANEAYGKVSFVTARKPMQ